MKAAFLEDGEIKVGELPEPKPERGQVLVRTHRCGLCASDNHFLCSGAEIVRRSQEFGGPYANVDLSQRIVMGHEFVGEVLDYGIGSAKPLKIGAKVTSVPIMRQGAQFGTIGYTPQLPGGYGEYMLLDENFLLEVPRDLDDDFATLIEPLAVGLEHARMGEPRAEDVAMVVGCGAIGLGVIVGLKLAGVGTIVAVDLNQSRREIALKMGADLTIDPRDTPPYGPLPALKDRRANLIYECVGKQGMLQQIMGAAGFGARIVVGGFCLEPEQIYVPHGQTKRLKLIFAAGEEPQDMENALKAITSGKIDFKPWLGERIGLGAVGQHLRDMSDPSSPIRTVVDPRLP